MELIDPRFKRSPIKHAQIRFASNASLGTTGALIAAGATGYANLIVYWKVCASAVASMGMLNGSGGTNFWNIHTIINETQQGPWWDTGAQGAATPVYAVSADGVGSGVIDVWYISVRRGAGAGATTP